MPRKLTITASLAATLTGLSGCDSRSNDMLAQQNTRICVDDDGDRIADQYCSNGRSGGGGFAFLYLRRGSPIPYYYDNVRDPKYAKFVSRSPLSGYTSAPPSSNMTRSSAVSRGGLGSSSRSFGRGG
ncbi:hypothetical protein [Sphingomonas sp. LHG3406-1]|uniref:hypothetical protein n=1 Tax=Sphingomonas sp. LHG3406-1 TaxID=2804617 RepID=UPI00260E0F8C|nr:hypothetical protein [Sphingomonas sp. LHG3406-1]